MWIKNFILSLWSILVFSLSTVSSSSGWKPIAPPVEYYVTLPTTTCVSDCDAKYKHPLLENSGGGEAEKQLKSNLLNQPLTFNQEKDFHQSNQKLDLEVFKPAEFSFFPQEEKAIHSPLPTYEDVLRKTPTSFFSFKSYGVSQKPTKTIYYGDLELEKPKFLDNVKYFKTYNQGLENDVKVLKTSNFIENDLKLFRPLKGNPFDEHCSIYKVSFRQDLYYQYVQYKVHMPELKEFTLCLWSRFHNHSHDHSLFSYAGKHHRDAIYMWVSNLQEPGLFNMKVMGQTIFRLNYPIKLYKWYHTCQSWNGNTGEWQVWVNSNRIGRGFHNLLVGHAIPGGGVAISGQQQKHFGKGFQEIPHFLKGSGGMEGEIAMLQLYKVALTAGKAYNDHRHHHSHYTTTTPEPPELPSEEPSTTTDHPFLENGQLKTHINVLELAEALRTKGNLDLPEKQPEYDFFHKDLSHSYAGLISALPVHGNTVNFINLPNHAIFKRNDGNKVKDAALQTVKPIEDQGAEEQKEITEKIKFLSNVTGQVKVEKVKYPANDKNEAKDLGMDEGPIALAFQLDRELENITTENLAENFTEPYSDESEEERPVGFRVGRKRLRRHNLRGSIRVIPNRSKRIVPEELKSKRHTTYGLRKVAGVSPATVSKDFRHKDKATAASKRHILFADPYLHTGALGLMDHEIQSSYNRAPNLAFFHDPFSHFGQDYATLQEDDDQNIDDNPLHEAKDEYNQKAPQPEVAEGEVRRVMELCSGCHLDPFRKVAVISWRSTPKKIYSGALFLKAKPECENF